MELPNSGIFASCNSGILRIDLYTQCMYNVSTKLNNTNLQKEVVVMRKYLKTRQHLLVCALLISSLSIGTGCTSPVQEETERIEESTIPCIIYDVQECMDGKYSMHLIYLQDENGKIVSFRIDSRTYADVQTMHHIGDKVTVTTVAKRAELIDKESYSYRLDARYEMWSPCEISEAGTPILTTAAEKEVE